MTLSRGSIRYNTRRAYLAARRSLSARLIEKRHGIETSIEANLGDFGLHDDERVRYEPSSWLALRRILPKRDVGADDVFVDLGSGKGRVVLDAAARYPFRRVIGVEIASQLTEVARANVNASLDRLRCRDIELVTADVLDYELPPDVTIAYIYNPFRGETFRMFMERMIESLDSSPRPFRLIYSTPMEHDSVTNTGRFRVIRTARGVRPTPGWSDKLSIRMYEFVPLRSSVTERM